MDIKAEDRGAPIDLNAITSASPDPKGFERLFQWLGGDQRELDPKELDKEFHTTTKILLDDEKVSVLQSQVTSFSHPSVRLRPVK